MTLPWIMISVIALLVIFAIVLVLLSKKGKFKGIDYYTLFIMGIIWIPLSVAIGNYFLMVAGFILIFVGLANKSKWKNKEQFSLGEGKERKKRILAILLVTGIAFVLAVVTVLIFFNFSGDNFQVSENNLSINSFEDCVDAGYAIMESYPRQCNDGNQTWVEEVDIIGYGGA